MAAILSDEECVVRQKTIGYNTVSGESAKLQLVDMSVTPETRNCKEYSFGRWFLKYDDREWVGYVSFNVSHTLFLDREPFPYRDLIKIGSDKNLGNRFLWITLNQDLTKSYQGEVRLDQVKEENTYEGVEVLLYFVGMGKLNMVNTVFPSMPIVTPVSRIKRKRMLRIE